MSIPIEWWLVAISLVGLWLTWIDRADLILSLRSYRWPSVPGKVTELRDESFEIDSVNPYTTSSRAKYIQTSYLCSYEVDGVERVTSRTAFGGHLDQTTWEFEVGDTVEIFYCPSDPDLSVLKPGIRFGSVFGLVVVVFAIAFYTIAKVVNGQ